jgi:hypothetical protein
LIVDSARKMREKLAEFGGGALVIYILADAEATNRYAFF